MDVGVVHDRCLQAALPNNIRIVGFFQGEHVGCGEIVRKPKRMTHLVQRQVDEKLVDQLFFRRRAQLQGPHREPAEHLAQVQFVSERTVTGLEAFGYLGEVQIVEDPLVVNAPRNPGILQHDVRADDLAGARIGERRSVAGKRRVWRGGPAQHVVTNVAGIPIGIVRLHPHFKRIAKTGFLERLVPGEHAFGNRLAELHRCRVLDPPDDGLHRFGQVRGGVLLDQVPALYQVAVGRDGIVGEVGDLFRKVTHAVVGEPRPVAVFRHRDQRVLQVDAHVPAVGHFLIAGNRGSRILVDVFHVHIRVQRIIADRGDLALLVAQAAQFKFVPVVSIGIGRRLDLQQRFAGEQVIGRDEHCTGRFILRQNRLGRHQPRADVGVSGTTQRALGIKVKGGVLCPNLDSVKVSGD